MRTSIKELKVGLNFGSEIQPVGRLAIRDGIIYFEYDNAFLETNLEISPIKLPLQRGVIELPRTPFFFFFRDFNDRLFFFWGRLFFVSILCAEVFRVVVPIVCHYIENSQSKHFFNLSNIFGKNIR